MDKCLPSHFSENSYLVRKTSLSEVRGGFMQRIQYAYILPTIVEDKFPPLEWKIQVFVALNDSDFFFLILSYMILSKSFI